MKKHKIIWFYVFTIIFTVILGGTFAALLDAENPAQYAISLAGAQLSPLCGLLLLCLFGKDFTPFKEMNWKISSSNKLILVLLAVLIPVFIICGSALTLSAIGKPYVPGAFNTAVPLVIVTVASIIGSIGEEVGWRGFMLPAFREKHSLLFSSVFTGLLWGAWYFGKISLFGITGYLLFVLMVTEWSVLMAWIFYKTGKSLPLMIAFHFVINICSVLMLNEREGISFYIAGCIVGGLLCLIVIVTNKLKLQRRTPPWTKKAR
ncbi:MAG: CPBP family intramembrane metalloprotease [Oscillospiraceae bacterium]|nr:CPBP family intramembrane metalloprotease [Oscillospiraceae bacterium]